MEGLFGLFNHAIPLDKPDRVTIIHGPNGFGKTVVLRMIASFLEGKTSVFQRTPFTKFSVTLSDGSQRVIHRHLDPEKQVGRPRARLEYSIVGIDGQKLPVESASIPTDIPRRYLVAVDQAVPSPYRLTVSHWVDDEGHSFSLSQILDKFPDAGEHLPRKYRSGLIFDITRDLEVDVFFVETNRLDIRRAGLRHDPTVSFRLPRPESLETDATAPRVEHHSRDLVGRMQSVTNTYARRSQERDRTFPERLVQFVREKQIALPERAILAKMSALETKRQRLGTLGLLDSESGLRGLTEEDVKRTAEALTIYVGDMDHKLNVFDDLARRIGSLVDIINNRFKYKTLKVDREQGFRVVTHRNQIIQLADLSSGEQHELIVLYELLFHGPENGLVLVDEPEISLHVGWQSRFLSDLIDILGLINAYGIVATHSPVVIGSRSDLTVQLTGPNDSGEGAFDAREP